MKVVLWRVIRCVIIINNTYRMDIFQFIGDFLHLIAVLMLLLKIVANKNVIGTFGGMQGYPTVRSRSSSWCSLPVTSIFYSVGRHSTFL
jgi:hypothetical protein